MGKLFTVNLSSASGTRAVSRPGKRAERLRKRRRFAGFADVGPGRSIMIAEIILTAVAVDEIVAA